MTPNQQWNKKISHDFRNERCRRRENVLDNGNMREIGIVFAFDHWENSIGKIPTPLYLFLAFSILFMAKTFFK